MATEFSIARPQLVPFARYRRDTIREQHQIVYPEGVLVLNETGHQIVTRCDGRLVSEIITSLGEVFGDAEVSEDVIEFLQSLFDKGLLRDADHAS